MLRESGRPAVRYWTRLLFVIDQLLAWLVAGVVLAAIVMPRAAPVPAG